MSSRLRHAYFCLVLRRDSIQDISGWQRTVLQWPVLYRLGTMDFLLPGLFLAALIGFFFRTTLTVDPGTRRILFWTSFAVMILAMNRIAFLFAGRGKVRTRRLAWALELLSRSGSLEVLPFCLATGIDFPTFCAALDEMMAEHYLLGYLDLAALKLVITDEPLKNSRCPACGSLLTDAMVAENACGFCRAVFYLS